MDGDAKYSGIETLEVLEYASNYNEYITNLIVSSANAGRILDFGAGSGTFAKLLRDAGYEVVCVEPDEELRHGLADEFEVYASLEDLGELKFDFIYSLNVLEHIEDDLAALHALKQRLEPDGVLFLYVPAFQILFSSLDRAVGHFRRYRRSELISKLSKAGLRIVSAKYADSLGFMAALVYRFMGNKDGSINKQQVIFFDKIVFPISLYIDKLTWRLLGKNVYVVATNASKPKPE